MATQPGLDTYRDALGSAFHLKADIDVADEVLVALPAQKAALGDVGMTRLTEEVARLLDGAPRSIGLLPDLGTFHAVFRIEATDGGVFYARTNLPAVPWPALDFAVDEWISATLGRRGLPVPAVRHVDLSRTRLPFDLEIVEAAAGESLTPGPATAPALEALGASVARLHTFGCRRFGLLDPASLDSERPPAGVHPTWSDYLLLNLDDHVAACHATGALTSAEAAATRAAFVEAEVLLAAAPSVLLHGDLSNRNVLVERGRIGTLLDWEDSLAGDPVFDIAGWGTLRRQSPASRHLPRRLPNGRDATDRFRAAVLALLPPHHAGQDRPPATLRLRAHGPYSGGYAPAACPRGLERALREGLMRCGFF